MLRNSPLKWVFPLGLYIAFCFDGVFGLVFKTTQSVVPTFTMLWLLFAVFFERDINMHLGIFAFVVGFVIDFYYYGTLGVFVFILPLIIYISKKLYKYLSLTFLTGFLICFIDITIYMTLYYMASRFVHLANVPISNFLVVTLWPTLLFNLVIYMILYRPVQKLYDHCQERE